MEQVTIRDLQNEIKALKQEIQILKQNDIFLEYRMLELEWREILKSQTRMSQEKDEEENTDKESYINLLSLITTH